MSLGTYKLPMRHPPDGVGAFFMSIIRQALKKHNPKAVPLGGMGTALVVEGGNSLSNQDYPPNQRTYPSDCEAGARDEPSPLGEGGRRMPDGRGELALKPRLPHNQRTHPNNCRSKKQHQIRKAIQPCKRAPPPPSPHGPTSHPKGEAWVYARTTS